MQTGVRNDAQDSRKECQEAGNRKAPMEKGRGSRGTGLRRLGVTGWGGEKAGQAICNGTPKLLAFVPSTWHSTACFACLLGCSTQNPLSATASLECPHLLSPAPDCPLQSIHMQECMVTAYGTSQRQEGFGSDITALTLTLTITQHVPRLVN